MRIVMFGTGPFAVPTLEHLLGSAHQVAALVTRPIENPGARRRGSANPMRDLGERHGLPIFDPADANDSNFVNFLRQMNVDLFVVCDFGQILSSGCLSAARLGGINLHGSLLPKYRGAAPVHWAIYHGDPVTGVSVILMSTKLDGGPILAQDQIDISPDDNTETLEHKLSRLGVGTVIRSLELLQDWDGIGSIGTPQDRALATRAPRLKKSDGLVQWSRSAKQIVDQVRAFQPWPGTYTNWKRDMGEPLRLILLRCRAVDSKSIGSNFPVASIRIVGDTPQPRKAADNPVSAAVSSAIPLETLPGQSLAPQSARPGQVVFRDSQQLLIQTGDGILAVDQIQPSGKKPMPISDFLRGYPVRVGDHFT